MPTPRIRELRLQANMQRKTLARELDVDSSTVYRWETTGDVPLKKALVLATMFGVSVEHLMGVEERKAA